MASGRPLLLGFIALWLAFQILVPLRHLLSDWVLPLTQPFERPEPRYGRDELYC